MNAYLVFIPEIREDSWYEMAPDPPTIPYGFYLAETPGQAKVEFMKEWRNSGFVESDDYTNLRYRTVARATEAWIPNADKRGSAERDPELYRGFQGIADDKDLWDGFDKLWDQPLAP